MQNIISRALSVISRPTVDLPAITQQTESHCGPAVLQMAFQFLGKQFTQDDVAGAAQVKKRIMKHGTRPDHLIKAVKKLTPEFQFWFKHPGSIEDLAVLIHKYHWPVIVNWQGLFYDTLEEEMVYNPDGEHGHYSVVVDVDLNNDKIIISDPYPDFAKHYRTFSLKWFETRWWDVDHVEGKKTKKTVPHYTNKLLFIITSADEEFPSEIGMLPPEQFKMLRTKK